MRDETGSDQLAHHHSQVGGDGHHSVLQIVVQLSAVLRDVNDLQKKRDKTYITASGRLTGHGGTVAKSSDCSEEVVTEKPTLLVSG